MTGSRSRRGQGAGGPARLAAIAVCIGVGISSTGLTERGRAQELGPPTVLAPVTGAEETAPPAPGAPPAEPGAAPPAEAEPERAPSGIEVAPLPTPRADYAGVLLPDQGGLGTDMWRDSDRGLVSRLLPSLPSTARSPAMRDLMRRLLLSSAEAPAGEAGERNLISVRAERLAAMGNHQGAVNLLRLIPEREMDSTAARLTVDALLFANDLDAACSEVDRWLRQFSDEVYWQKALIFCQTRAGKFNEAALGLSLLREQGHGGDEAFFTLIDALSGVKDATVKDLATPTALHLAMMRAAGRTLPESILKSENPAVLAWVATSPSADPALRLAAAERAAAAGALPAAELRRLYAGQAIDPEEVDNALSLAETEPGPHSRAALYQAAARAQQPVARATVLREALELARESGDYPTAVQVYLESLTQLEPAPELAWFALEAGRALYLAGRADLAERWLSLARAEARRDPEAAAAASALWLLTRVAGRGDAPLRWDAAAVEAWRDHQAAGGDERANLRAARLFAVLEGLDEPVGAAWRVLADGAPPGRQAMPNPALWFMLGDAAAGQRVGETVLLALVSLGPEGPAAASPIVLSRVLSSLKAVGLEAEARALGIETAVANGV